MAIIIQLKFKLLRTVFLHSWSICMQRLLIFRYLQWL